jgi:hypothetical protein
MGEPMAEAWGGYPVAMGQLWVSHQKEMGEP